MHPGKSDIPGSTRPADTRTTGRGMARTCHVSMGGRRFSHDPALRQPLSTRIIDHAPGLPFGDFIHPCIAWGRSRGADIDRCGSSRPRAFNARRTRVPVVVRRDPRRMHPAERTGLRPRLPAAIQADGRGKSAALPEAKCRSPQSPESPQREDSVLGNMTMRSLGQGFGRASVDRPARRMGIPGRYLPGGCSEVLAQRSSPSECMSHAIRKYRRTNGHSLHRVMVTP